MVAYACNTSTVGGWGRNITWGQELKSSLGNSEILFLRILKKKKKIKSFRLDQEEDRISELEDKPFEITYIHRHKRGIIIFLMKKAYRT